MNQRLYSPASLRALIETFAHPMVVASGEQLSMVNTALLQLIGLSREHVEGQSILNFVSQEERSRLAARFRRFAEEQRPPSLGAVRRLIPSANGRMIDVATCAQELRLENGEKVMLISIFEMRDRPPVLAIAERLVETSARLVSAHSAPDVRRVALEGLAAAGFRATFLSWDGKMVSSSEGAATHADAALAVEAISEGRPIYGGV